MRQLSRALHRIPQLLLVQPEQLAYDLAFALALAPLVIAGVIFFRQQSALTFALALLAGIVCLLALQLARLTFGLPAWVGHKATHPLVASLLIACFLSPVAPAWLAASLVIVFVVMDTVLWPQLQRVMLHPALIVLGLLFIAQRQLHVGFINPFDLRRLDDPLTLWYHLRISIDPIKLYVGNVPGPIGVTSAAAVLLGVIYLWYTRKVSLGVFLGFFFGVAAAAVALGQDVAFQLASGPALFVAGYIAADRRRVLLSERYTFLFGAAAGAVTVALRWYGQGQEAAWMSLLAASVLVTVFLRMRWIIGHRSIRSMGGRRSFRTLTVESGEPEPRIGFSSVRQESRQPAMAMSGTGTAFKSAAGNRPMRAYDAESNPNDLVRQMRSAANRGAWSAADNPVIWLLALVIVNPVGLWLTWNRPSLDVNGKRLITAASAVWYLAVAGLVLALTHLR